MGETKIPLYVAIAFNHLQKAEKAHQKMRTEFSAVCKEHMDKGDINTLTLGNLVCYGLERRPDGYYVVYPDPESDAEEGDSR